MTNERVVYLSRKVINEYQERIQVQIKFIREVYNIFDIREEASYQEALAIMEARV